MKKMFMLAMLPVVMFGLLFPVSRTDKKGPSPFFQEIKKFFHYGDTERTKVKKVPTKFKKELKKQLRYPDIEKEEK